ncbi:MAG: biopolymer transporter ExbD [Verrucomicrobiota bacterium]
MKFPRNAKILRSQFDIAPFAAVFFCLVLLLLLGTLLPTVGLPLLPPSAADLPGATGPLMALAVDAGGQLYFENGKVNETQLTNRFAALAATREPLTLIIHADQAVTYGQLAHIVLLARHAGITNSLLATLPRVEAGASRP